MIARLVLDLCRTTHETLFPGVRFGSDFDLLFVFLAVFIGEAEGRPMTGSKIAAYLDKPRPTTLRKLEKLCRRGFIERERRRYTVSAEYMGSGASTERLIRMVGTAMTKLSKLDKVSVAKSG